MLTLQRLSRIAVFGAACIFACTGSFAQTPTPLLNQVHTVATAAVGVPVEESFTVTAAGNYTVTLTDLGAQLQSQTGSSAALTSVGLAITNSSGTLVTLAPVNGSPVTGNTQLTAAGAVTITAAADTYVIHVVGTPAAVAGSGPIGIRVTGAGNSQLAAFSDNLALPTTSDNVNNIGVLNDTFTVGTSGDYVVTLTDQQIPSPVNNLTLAIVVEGGSLLTPPTFGTASGNPATTTVTLQTGTNYRIFAGGGGQGNSGLYSVAIAPVSTGGSTPPAPIYTKSVPVGAVSAVATPTLNAVSYTLRLADLTFPSALAQVGAVVMLNGVNVAALSAAGTKTFTGTAASYELYAYGIPGNSGQGSYDLSLKPASGPGAISLARAVTAAGGTIKAYNFDTTLVGGEVYSLAVADFGFPAQLASVSAAVVQNGQVLGSGLSAAGTQNNIIPASGPASVLVFAQKAAAANGLFGVNLIAGGAATAALATTQGVGPEQLFSSNKVTISTGGNYQVTVSDVGFPATFANLAVLVTQGATTVGAIYNAGTKSFQVPAAGDYYVSFVAQPQASATAGTYAITLAPQPPAPTVTLQANPTSVDSGGTVTLQWSSSNATACTASGGWTGVQTLTGQATTSAITADTTFTLTCTGGGQSAASSATVKVNSAPAKSGGGGGGAIRLDLIALLLGVLLMRVMPKEFLRSVASTARVGALAGVLILAGCGGAASRLESHLQRGRDYMAKDDYTHASIEFRNAMQIAPKNLSARLLAAEVNEKLGKVREAVGLYQSIVDTGDNTTDPNAKLDQQAADQVVAARAALGRLLAFAGQTDRALQIIEPALAKHPDSVPLLLDRATVRLRSNNESGALADVERVLKLAPKSEEGIALRAGLYRRAGQTPQAIDFLNDAIKQQPQSTSLREVLAELYLANNDTGKVEEQLHALIQLKPQALTYRKDLALFYARSQRLDDAQHVLEEAVKAIPHDPEAKLTLVRFISTQRTREQGEKILREFIAQEPNNFDLRFGLADLLQRSGALKEAIDAYQEVIRQDDKGPKGLLARDRIAAIEFEQGKDEEARKLVAEVLEKSPRDPDALLVRGQLEMKHRDLTAAIADLRAVSRDQPNAVSVHRLLARAYLDSGEPALAEQSLRAAMDVTPGDPSLRVELSRLYLGSNRADQAVELLEETVRKAPSYPEARELLVRAYMAKSNLIAARQGAEDLKTLLPKEPTGFYLAGLVAQAQNRPDDAKKEYEHAVEVKPRAFDALLALARLELSRGHSDQAIAEVKDVVQHDPKNPLAQNLLGELYMEQKNIPAAVESLTAAVNLAPTWWSSYRDLAMAKFAGGDSNGAIATYEAAIKVAPAEPRLVAELAQMYEKLARYDDAIAVYDNWSKANPSNRAVANNLAMLLVTYKSDRASLDRARQLTAGFESSNDGTLLDTNGWVHFKRAEYNDALSVLERAAERAPKSKEIRYHLGMAELHAGKSDRARSDLEVAVSGETKSPWTEDARTILAGLKGNTG